MYVCIYVCVYIHMGFISLVLYNFVKMASYISFIRFSFLYSNSRLRHHQHIKYAMSAYKKLEHSDRHHLYLHLTCTIYLLLYKKYVRQIL